MFSSIHFAPAFSGLLLRVQVGFFKALKEDLVVEADVTDAMTVVEGVVPREDVVMPPGQLPRVHGQYACREPAVVRALQHAQCLFIVGTLIELEESGPVAVGFANFFDAVAAR